MTLLVRDEEELLDLNINYHRSVGVDFFIITDNNSTDRTPEIIKKYVALGIAKYIREPEEGYFQVKWIKRMARMAYERYNAKWIIHNDADEFWWSNNRNLKSELDNLPNDVGVVIVNRHNFIPRKENGENFYDTMDVKNKVSTNFRDKPLPPKVIHRGTSCLEITMGNHQASVKGFEKNIVSDTIETFHYPMRSYRQFEEKITKSGDLSAHGMTRGWDRMYGLYKEGKLEEYYNSNLFSEEEIEKKIGENILIRDTRLKDYLNALLKR